MSAPGQATADAIDIARALRGFRDGNAWRVACPFVSGHPRTKGRGGLSVKMSVRAGLLRCSCAFSCPEGDILASLRRRGFLDGAGDVSHAADPEALAIWRTARPIAGTLGEQYFRTLGVDIPLPPSLRFRPAGKVRLPMVVALVQAPDRTPIAALLLLLDRDAPKFADVPSPRIAVGALGRGAIRLGPVAHGIDLVDSLEEGLLATQRSGRSTWITLGAWRRQRVELPTPELDLHHVSNLTTNERALIAARMASLVNGSNQYVRRLENEGVVATTPCVSLNQASTLMGVSRDTVACAKTIIDHGSATDIAAAAVAIGGAP